MLETLQSKSGRQIIPEPSPASLFPLWLKLHLGKHLIAQDPIKYYELSETEADIVDEMVGLPIRSVGDLCALLLATTNIGQQEVPDEVWEIINQIADRSFNLL
jgi:hypothetical protein